jgi:hypothetical protein
MTRFAPAPQSQGPNPFDAAETFAELDVTVTADGVYVVSGAIELGASPTATFNADNEITDSKSRSVEVNPNEDIPGLKGVLPAGTGTVDQVFITDANANLVADVTGSFSGGDEVVVSADLQAGTEYHFGIYNSGDSFTYYSDDSPGFTVSTDEFDIPGSSLRSHPGGSGPDKTTNSEYPWDEVSAAANSGTAAVEWPAPEDVYEWDCATYQQTPDGETVEVFAARDDGTGWARVNGGDPIDRCYSLADDPQVSPSDNVRLEVKLERQDASNKPRLDAAYRTWRV